MGESEVAKGGPDLVGFGDFIDDLDQAADGKSMSGSDFFFGNSKIVIFPS